MSLPPSISVGVPRRVCIIISGYRSMRSGRKNVWRISAYCREAEYVTLLRGFDEVFYRSAIPSYGSPPRRYRTGVRSLKFCHESENAGVYIAASKDGRQIFVTGHSEYDPLTLKWEYDRDQAKGLTIDVPKNYFPNDDPALDCRYSTWRAHANLLFSNWLNYYVYQQTPYELRSRYLIIDANPMRRSHAMNENREPIRANWSIQEPVTGAVSFPIYQATAFRHPKLGQSTGFDYARTKSPPRKVLEEAAAELGIRRCRLCLQLRHGCTANDFRLIQSRRSFDRFAGFIWRYLPSVGAES